MKAIFLSLLFSICVFTFSYAQTPGEWVWLHGDSITNNPGIFGIQGIPDSANYPPSLYEPCEWTDLNGNFWLWGGLQAPNVYSDLWKYNPATNKWTWMKGPGIPNDLGNYGTQGVPSPYNNPPNSSFGINSWVDLNGNLWMFGGGGSAPGIYSDLWKYDIATNEWTWMKGPGMLTQPGTYGIKGTPDPANNPPSRSETAASWTDNNGDLWMFGGTGYNSPYPDYNDMWKFDITSNNWTWMNGSSLPDQPSVYGTRELEDSLNTPGARWAHTCWKDLQGNFWIYGGSEDWNAGQTNRTDLWKFNPNTNKWASMNGDTVGNIFGLNGTECFGADENQPSFSIECRATWTDSNNNLWGFIYGNGIYNSLWMYCQTSKDWAIIKSDSSLYNASPVWGTKGISSPSTMPMGLQGPIGWTDLNGHLYMFGGYWGGGICSNALWMYTIDSCCSACNTGTTLLDFSATDTVLCPGTCLDINNNSQSYFAYQWQFPGGNPSTSNSPFPQNICYTSPGIYDVSVVGTGCNASDTLTYSGYITILQQPSPQSITQSGDTLFAIAGASVYQWYFDGTIISGATNYFYVAQSSGDYNVVATDTNGCEVEAVINDVLANMSLAVGYLPLAIYPNPVADEFTIQNLKVTRGTAVEISIYNVFGGKIDLAVNSELWTVDCRPLPPGMYYIEISTNNNIFRSKFLKQ